MTIEAYYRTGYNGDAVTLVRAAQPGLVATTGHRLADITPEEADQIILALAPHAATVRVLDHVEVAEITKLADEIEEDPNDYASATTAWVHWQDRAEALASAVITALQVEGVRD